MMSFSETFVAEGLHYWKVGLELDQLILDLVCNILWSVKLQTLKLSLELL